MNKSGIYTITQISSGKTYVGSSVKICKRWAQHKYHLNAGTHRNSHLQHAWNKYGGNDFRFEVVQLVQMKQLLDVEQEYLDKVRNNPASYFNISTDATAPMTGKKFTEDHKQKIGNAHKGKVLTDTHRLQLSNARKGKPLSELHKSHIKEACRHSLVEHTLINKTTNESFTGTRLQICNMVGLNPHCAGRLSTLLNNKGQGLVKSVKGWTYRNN